MDFLHGNEYRGTNNEEREIESGREVKS